jgi:hypothetical protein
MLPSKVTINITTVLVEAFPLGRFRGSNLRITALIFHKVLISFLGLYRLIASRF